MARHVLITLFLCGWVSLLAQPVSKTWQADLGNGMYKNPVLHADYSDPDVCRVGDEYYMTASSFNAVPGLPVLQSKDLVNWKLIGHALKRQVPLDHFEKVQHGNGVWAPAIRYHNNEFYIYYPDPDFGIYLTKAKAAAGPWSEPILVEAGKGLIDPAPLWDEDGTAYLVHAYAGSRAGIKSVLVVKKLSTDGSKVIDAGRLVYDGHAQDPTIEGPKLYKRNNFYYIFAPAGGVTTGWQVVLRSENIYGPYERKIVLAQGTTSTNGPHQGAWISTPAGEDWFVHFQDKGAYGRVVHLQPMRWVNDWPVIGEDKDGDGTGQPVATHTKPVINLKTALATPPESDEFNDSTPGLQWQWQANPQATWYFTNTASGSLRLYSTQADGIGNLWQAPNLLLQKFPAEEFSVTTKLTFQPNTKIEAERTGLVILGSDYAGIGLKHTTAGVQVTHFVCMNADKAGTEVETVLQTVTNNQIYLRVSVSKNASCNFSYSMDGKKFTPISNRFEAKPGKWVGAKVGLFCVRTGQTNDAGFADVDWFRVEPLLK
ncbi:MAG: glycoside hydrolase 43 family protein [Cyclobacteriaceae bacterium]|nr:glycoside hydrolase 43 family protein [Cyclobacteriaceae bacterium]